MRRYRYPDPRYHGAYRENRYPLRRQYSVYPAPTIDKVVKEKIAEYTRRLAKALHVKGLINIQFIAIGDEVYVIEVNPRSSRTVPYISKVTGILSWIWRLK